MATLPRSLVQRRTNSLDSERENFNKSQAVSVQKAINSIEGSVKEKHVRFILIGTHHERGPYTFWEIAMRLPVQENPILAWKFCYVVHKLLREGHEKCIPVSFRYMNKFAELGRLWGLLNEGYGRLIELYCSLILQKLRFHARYQGIPGTLVMSDEQLLTVSEGDVNVFFQFACDIFDYMERVLALQAAVFGSLDMARANSMTNSGQCRLAPLICCIQDSSQLYDFAVKVLFHLHAQLPSDTLQGHRDRFMAQFRLLRGFYSNCANLQYFKTLVQVPTLPLSPPNLLKASELNSHVRPVVVLPPQPPEPPEVADDLIDTSSPVHQVSIVDSVVGAAAAGAGSPPPPPRNASVDNELAQRKDAIIEQLLKELEVARMEAQRVRLEDDTVAMELRLQQATLEGQLRAEQENVRHLQGQLAARLESHQVSEAMQNQLEQLETKCKQSEEKFLKMKGVYTKLREEHIRLLRAKAELEKKLQAQQQANEASAIGHQEQEGVLSSRSGLLLASVMEAVVDGAVSELDIPLSQDRFLQNAEMTETTLRSLRPADGAEEEAQLQATCVALVHQTAQLLQSAKASAHHCPNVEAGHEIITRARTVGLSSIELFKRLRIGEVDTTTCLASLKELVACVEAQRLQSDESNLKEDIGHLLAEELAQMDKAIADATNRISEILAKSRGTDQGVKLEVNSRILGACQLLIGAVMTLVKAARHLQEEIGGFSKEFYTKNHRWTEGLISAAKVVGIAANLLVDAADRCVTGNAKMEELIVASQEISAATAQLLVASKVKADRQSTRLAALGAASKAVRENTANVVAIVKSCREQMDDCQDALEGLSLHQAKRREMEIQLRVLELETDLNKERLRLGALRRRHYNE